MENLKKLRIEKGIKQQEIAEYLGMARAAYSKYETGTRNPDPDTLNKIADFLECTTDYLLGRSDDPIPPNKTTAQEEISQEEKEEVKRMVDELAKRPELRILFHQSEKLNKQDVELAINIVETVVNAKREELKNKKPK